MGERPTQKMSGLVSWPDGEEEGPDAERMLRQVPGECGWDQQTWVSRDGAVHERVFDPLDETWSWGPARPIHLLGEGAMVDSFAVDVFSGRARRRMRLARAIALAWVHCDDDLEASGASEVHALPCAAGPIEASTIHWRRAGTLPFGGVHNEWCEPAAPTDRRWRPLRYEWRSANGDLVETIAGDTLYDVHPDGWVRSRISGRATRGHRTPDGARWVAIHSTGLANVDRARALTFEPRPEVPPVAPLAARLRATLAALSKGTTAAEICRTDAIVPATLWGRTLAIARDAAWTEATRMWRLVPRSVREVLRDESIDEHTGIRALTSQILERAPPNDPLTLVNEEDVYGMVGLGWALVRRERLRARTGEQR